MIVRPVKGRIFYAFRLAASTDKEAVATGLVESSEEIGSIIHDRRIWVIVLSIISIFRMPMQWTGMTVDFIFNLPSENGGPFGLLLNLVTGT